MEYSQIHQVYIDKLGNMAMDCKTIHELKEVMKLAYKDVSK